LGANKRSNLHLFAQLAALAKKGPNLLNLGPQFSVYFQGLAPAW
jgi:hypothetical protein